MKAGTKRILYTISAVILALGLGIGAILLSMLNVQASSEMMPGIEQIIDEKSDQTPFRILELVNKSSDAEIGYYISGQEPYLSQYTYTPQNSDGTAGKSQTFSSVEEGLSVLPTAKLRKEFVEGSSSMVKNPLDLSWKANNPGTTKEEDYPLSFKSYAEKYFLSKTDDSTKWNRVDFKESRKETLKGHYEESSDGTGDYTKEEQQYYPIREDVDTDGSSTQKYRENIKNFFYSDDTEAAAPYQLSFETVDNTEVNESLSGDGKEIEDAYDYSKGGFGYYENVYSELTSEITDNIANKKYMFPGENPTVSDTETPDNNMGGEDDVTADIGEEDTAGTQENPYIYRGENIDDYPYYKYTLVGDMEAVKAKAKECEGTTERKDGDITLESDQYWYWSAENTENDDESDSTEDTSAEATTETGTEDNTGTTGTESNTQAEEATTQAEATDNNDISAQAADDGSDTVLKKEALCIVTGRQAVSSNQVRAIPEDFTYDYYYKVSSVSYCCKLSDKGNKADPEDYTYYGWYYASHPSGEDVYIEVKEDSSDATGLEDILQYDATHYISEAQYTLTPGEGNYNFIQSDTDSEKTIEIDHLFYQGGYTNHDWFKHYVFHLDPNSTDETIQKQFKNLSIKVDTKIINSDNDIALSDLSDYDLVYVNGELTSTQAEHVASNTNVPAILNQNTANADIINEAFAAWVDTSLSGEAYVSQNKYFITKDLFNLKFHQTFSAAELDNYTEISSYITSENNYRELIETGENNQKTDPLSEEISQARVIEYIINYKYKRKVNKKDTVNILDIEPASATASLTQSSVRKWLGISDSGEQLESEVTRGTIQDFCCEETTGEGTNGPISKVLDGDNTTYWHSRWSSNKEAGPHWFKYKLSKADSKRKLKGFRYVARPNTKNGYANGKPLTLTVEMYDTDGNLLGEETAELSDNVSELNSWTEKNYVFSKSVQNVSYIKVIFTDCYNNEVSEKHSNAYATCAEFSTLYTDNNDDDTGATQINITHMTSSEFVGHIDDINTEYDAIYFGDSYSNWDFRRNGDLTVGETENSQGKKVSLYSHAGGIFGGTLDRSYYDSDSGSWVEGAAHNRWIASRLMGLLDIDYAKDNDGNFITKDGLKLLRSPNNTPGEIGKKIGRMRGSGNDITKQQLKELKDFVSSGYPVIIGNGLLNSDGTAVNTDVVDSSSYIYEFLNDAIDQEKDRVNVMSKATADKKQNLNFFFYLAKPEIKFSKMPPEPERLNNSKYKYNKEAELKLLPQSEDGLTYKFTIENNSEISTANATYNCELFIDLNFDGNLSSTEEQTEYMQIQDEKGNVVKKENGKYQLKIGKEYTLTRKIPKDYYKVITWKIQISNNDNPAIRTSRMGFTKREAGEKQSINVLQIYPVAVKGKLADVTWYLNQDDEFKQMLNEVEDFNITITEKDTRSYEKEFKEAKAEGRNLLDKYQMIIIGFADGFGIDNIDNSDGAVDAIRDFIEDGKSVLFSHDTTSFVNTTGVVRPDKTGSYNAPSLYNPNTWPTLDPMPAAWDWGYSLNTFLRASVGMDRYGITSDEKITVNGKTSTVSAELKKGNDLTKGDGIYEAIKNKVADMAYVAGNKNTTSLMTQGFSNNVLDNNNHYAYKVSKVNEGAITQYPNYIADLMPTSRTHSQYYQLAMEEDSDKDGANDIVVWYCLSGDGGDWSYQSSPNDVRNNYYFYSKGNVIYTGVGDSGQADAKTGTITKEEKQLFVNAIVAAANVSAVEPEATFVEDFDPTADQEEYRYYMPDRLKASELSGSESNILNGSNTFNIRIRDYNMVASSLNYNDNNSGSLSMELYIEDSNGTEMTINGTKVKVSKLSTSDKVSSLKKYSDGGTITVSDGKFKLPGNDTFQFALNNMESYLKKSDGSYKKNCRIFARIESTVTLYGTTANKETWTSIGLRPRQLFDLD